jgi:hypothetical protein
MQLGIGPLGEQLMPKRGTDVGKMPITLRTWAPVANREADVRPDTDDRKDGGWV